MWAESKECDCLSAKSLNVTDKQTNFKKKSCVIKIFVLPLYQQSKAEVH